MKDLFEIKSYKKRFDANKVKLTENIGHPYIVRQSNNNGQKGFINENPEFLNDGNTISFGQDTATIFYQENSYFTGDKIKILHSKNNKFRKENALFFISAMNKAFSNFSWGSSRFDIETLESQKILLPTKDGKIDFEFMEKFITELESERIIELEAYLTAEGLKDFILTDEEKFALENLNSCIWEKFLLKDLFEKKTVRGVPKKEENLTPNEQGFYMYGQNILHQYDYKILCDEKYLQIVDEKYPILAYSASVGEIGIIKESFYRGGTHGAFQGLFPKKKYSLKIMLYFLTTLKIHFKQFNYDTSMADVMNLKIYLPTKDGEIDYEFMEKFITAVQKIIIADVVKYSEEKISAYRQAANK